jgi:hypothetical protein
LKRSLERHGCKWEDNIKMGLKVMGYAGVDWIHLAQKETSGGVLCSRSPAARFFPPEDGLYSVQYDRVVAFRGTTFIPSLM